MISAYNLKEVILCRGQRTAVATGNLLNNQISMMYEILDINDFMGLEGAWRSVKSGALF